MKTLLQMPRKPLLMPSRRERLTWRTGSAPGMGWWPSRSRAALADLTGYPMPSNQPSEHSLPMMPLPLPTLPIQSWQD